VCLRWVHVMGNGMVYSFQFEFAIFTSAFPILVFMKVYGPLFYV
jgi:hypothetical protein